MDAATISGRDHHRTVRLKFLAKNAEATRGRVVDLYGILQSDGSIEGLISCVPASSYRYSYRLVLPQRGVVGWDTQSFNIEIIVQNTGRQTIRKLSGLSRMWQVQSPNDETKNFEIGEIPAGESRTASVNYEIFNFLIIGRTSTPQVFARIDNVEW